MLFEIVQEEIEDLIKLRALRRNNRIRRQARRDNRSGDEDEDGNEDSRESGPVPPPP